MAVKHKCGIDSNADYHHKVRSHVSHPYLEDENAGWMDKR